MQDFLLRWDGTRQAISLVLFSTLLLLVNLTFSTPAYSFVSTYTVGQLTASPAGISFGNVPLGTNQTQSLLLTNTGGTDLTVTNVSVSNSAFTVSGLNYPLTLGMGKSASCVVTFSPQVGGNTSGTISIAVFSKRRYRRAIYSTSTVSVSGSGVTVGQLVASPQSLSFGNIQVGGSRTVSEILTNSGGSSLTISQAVLSGSGFTQTGLTLPLTLNPSQSTTFNVTFTPLSSGPINGSISISSNGSNPTLVLGLSGTGVLNPGTLSPNPSGLSFGNVQVGSTQSLSTTLTNSGGSALTISQANLSTAGFNLSGLSLPLTLNVGQSAAVSILFSPQSAGSLTGNLTIVSNASNSSLSIPLSGTGVTPAVLSANPNSLSFGSVAAGSTKTLSQVLTNSGGSALTISQITPSGAGFGVSGMNTPVTLNPSQSLTFSVTFAPTSAGAATGTLSISSTASNSPTSVALTGTGTVAGQLALSPSTINFGNVIVGSSVSQAGTLTASGASVTVSSLWGNSSEFTVSGITLPRTLAAGSSASFNVTFAPKASGTTSASLGFVSDASGSPTLQTLTGTGLAPVQHSVALTWNPSTSSTVAGYNLYRGTSSGGPYTKMNSSLNLGTSDTDATVQSGKTYYYVVTAVDSNGAESVFSNQAQAVIP